MAEAIIKDVRQSKDLIADRKFKTIYFGGGTPSLASTESIKHILDSIKDKFLFNKTEITLEMNPNDVSGDRIDELLNSRHQSNIFGHPKLQQPRVASIRAQS